MRTLAAVLLAAISPALFAQSSLDLPGCEPQPEVRRILEEKLSGQTLQQMRFTERVAYRRQVLEDLIAKYPREAEPYRRLIQVTEQDEPDNYAPLVERYRKQAEQHPDDPLAQYVAGLALENRNTPLSIQFLEQARAQAKEFAWPALELAIIYSPGAKRADKKKAAEEIADFFGACPSSTERNAGWPLDRAGTSELQVRVAATIRVRLATETDPKRLKDYATLWDLEFHTHPPQEYDAVRKQVAADLERLEPLNSKPDAGWLAFQVKGYQQSGASPETLAAKEDRVIAAFPHSDEAYRIVRARWEKAHKEPEDGNNAAAWAKYHSELKAALKIWIAQFTDSRQLQHEEMFYAVRFDPEVPAEEGLHALNDYLDYIAAYQQPSSVAYLMAAEFLADHKWQPRRVLELLRDSDKLMDQWHAHVLSDNLAAEEEKIWTDTEAVRRQAAAAFVLVAARLAGQPAEAQRFKPFIERDLPAKSWPNFESRSWLNRGRLAALEGRSADALAYYQKALHARKRPPDPVEGWIIDELTDEARALWKQLGGTETAWNIWSKPPAAKIQELAESGWRKPAKTMPPFELADLSGKTWRLKDLGGRAVLINVWATWCGPCQAELPRLQKLYEQVKDRADLQILTLTIDEDPGVVAPFLKEKGYTFPVLPAYGFVTELLDLVAIPQNWIVDAKGEWRWTGAPDAPDAEWGAAMLKQLESAR
ncbi:MAG: TlpA disulfide reductase family protein [Bryobacteraceae bacterium]|nr:TlpA disulfide reductase family protein [Bryobacteraceae bacterium]